MTIQLIGSKETTYLSSKKEPSTKFSSKAQGPKATNQDNFEVSKEISFRAKIGGPSKALRNVKFLLSKAVYERKTLSFKEQYLLLECWDYLLEYKDYPFWTKNHLSWKTLSGIFNIVRKGSSGILTKEVYLSTLQAVMHTMKPCLPSVRAYFGWVKTFRVSRFVVRNNRRLRLSPPPQRYIGVGYRDQGTCRIPELDASPSWQEVATVSQVELINRNPVLSRFHKEIDASLHLMRIT
jgi:hypothetical protein